MTRKILDDFGKKLPPGKCRKHSTGGRYLKGFRRQLEDVTNADIPAPVFFHVTAVGAFQVNVAVNTIPKGAFRAPSDTKEDF